MKTLSVIIPTRNEGSNLLKTVNKFLESSRDIDSEIIIADDASTDDSVKSIDYTEKKVILTQANGGPHGTAASKCLGAEASSGSVLLFADGHTSISKDDLEKLVDLTEKYGIVSTALCNIDEGWNPTHKRISQAIWWNLDAEFKKSWYKVKQLRGVEDGVSRGYGVNGGFYAVRRDVHNEVGGWDRNNLVFSVDAGFSLRAWCLGFDIFHANGIIAGHLYKKVFRNTPSWWHIYHNRFRALYCLGTPEEKERFSQWQVRAARRKALEYIEQTMQTIPRFQPRLKRTLTDYMNEAPPNKKSEDKNSVSMPVSDYKITIEQSKGQKSNKPSGKKCLKIVSTLTDDYAIGTYALINSLIQNGKINFEMVLVKYGDVSQQNIDMLKGLGVSIEIFQEKELGESNRPILEKDKQRLSINTQKTLVWKLPYNENMIYLDSDIICLSPVNDMYNWQEFTVAQKRKHNDEFNSGVFCFRPDSDTYNIINEQAASYKSPIALGDQQTLMDVFCKSRNGKLSDRMKRVGYSWNISAHIYPKYLTPKALRVKFLHFSSTEKPWKHEPPIKKVDAYKEWLEYVPKNWEPPYNTSSLFN